MRAVTDAVLESGGARMKVLLHTLATMTKFESGTCHPSVRTLAQRMCCSQSTVYALIAKAVDLGYITKVRGGGGSAYCTNVYMLEVTKLETLAIRRSARPGGSAHHGYAVVRGNDGELNDRELTPPEIGGQASNLQRPGVQKPEARPPGIGDKHTNRQTINTPTPASFPLSDGGGGGSFVELEKPDAATRAAQSVESLCLLERAGVSHSKAVTLARKLTPEEIQEGKRCVRAMGPKVRDFGGMLVYVLEDGTAKAQYQRKLAKQSAAQVAMPVPDPLPRRTAAYQEIFEFVSTHTAPKDHTLVQSQLRLVAQAWGSAGAMAEAGVLRDERLFSQARYWDLFNEIVKAARHFDGTSPPG